MIKKQGIVQVHDHDAVNGELHDSVAALPDGEYNFLIYDNSRNRPLPQLKYFFGTVLKTISDRLPDHPPVEALYRYFEETYAPMHTTYVGGEKFEYFDLKSEKSIEMDGVIEKVIRHAATQWGIKVPLKDAMSAPEAKELYIGAYTEMWKDHVR